MLTAPTISRKPVPRIDSPGNGDVDLLIKALLRSVLPEMTSRRIGRLTGKSHRVAQKWLSSEMPVPDDVFHQVELQAELLKSSTFPADLEAAIAKALGQGLHSEIIASHLAAKYKEVTGLEIE
jgi:hypothetical protein